jgi:hypothetical protein
MFLNIIPTSQESHDASTTNFNQLMLFSETTAIYCIARNTEIYYVAEYRALDFKARMYL